MSIVYCTVTNLSYRVTNFYHSFLEKVLFVSIFIKEIRWNKLFLKSVIFSLKSGRCFWQLGFWLVDGGWGNRTQDRQSAHGLQADHYTLYDTVLLHCRPGKHRPYVPVLIDLVYQSLRDVHWPRWAIWWAEQETGQPEEPLHLLVVLQCLSVALWKRQGAHS